tara:strand:- start:304 stop:1497 length:1194 start_codon:yes stop_codon:yes gene_type:complete
MPYLHSFGSDDLLMNRMITRPKFNFTMYSGSAYINNGADVLGVNVTTGTINLYEYNVDRNGSAQNLIYPYVTRDTGLVFRSNAPSLTEYNSLPRTVQEITGSYPLTASITRQYFNSTPYPFPGGTNSQKDAYVVDRRELISLQNTMNYYRYLSNNYAYTGSYVSGTVNMLQIPSIMYGEEIKKGTVSLKFYYTGSLIDEAVDSRQNGELISTMGNTSGSTVGVVLYNEGFILLTSSMDISNNQDYYLGTAVTQNASWQYFGAYDLVSTGGASFATASLFSVDFEGTQKIPTMTLFATAQPGDLNNSQNPTWVSSSDSNWRDRTSFSGMGYKEPNNIKIKNTIHSQYCNYEQEFQKQTYITEIGVFDKDKNLIGVAKLANPVQKKEADNYTFKLKLDM